MKLAFYAPLKSPNHTIPSGDRTMGRALLRALQHGGHQVDLASSLRAYDGVGSSSAQNRIISKAATEVDRLLKLPQAREWQAWLTYHNYYKAPDLVGPSVCKHLDIPYFQVESTRARKRLQGPWATFAHAAEQASDFAHTIFYVTHRDAETLERDAPKGQELIHLPPFLNQDKVSNRSDYSGGLLSVGMMRHGDKLASYTLVAQTLSLLDQAQDWTLTIAGDGPARPEIEGLMAPFADRVNLMGSLSADALRGHYACAKVLFWPGVNEAFGFAYLEAQAAGVPVVAQDRPGVRDVVAGLHPTVTNGPAAMAQRLSDYLSDQAELHRAGTAAQEKIKRHHLLPSAARVLNSAIAAAQ